MRSLWSRWLPRYRDSGRRDARDAEAQPIDHPVPVHEGGVPEPRDRLPSSATLLEAPESIHGELSCTEPERFYCPVCERHVCWCNGASGDVDDLVAYEIAKSPMAGVCNDCWCLMRDIGHELHDDCDLPDEFRQ